MVSARVKSVRSKYILLWSRPGSAYVRALLAASPPAPAPDWRRRVPGYPTSAAGVGDPARSSHNP